MRPLVRDARPAMARNKVDLPQPDSPTRPKTSLVMTLKLTLRTASRRLLPLPKATVASDTSITRRGPDDNRSDRRTRKDRERAAAVPTAHGRSAAGRPEVLACKDAGRNSIRMP